MPCKRFSKQYPEGKFKELLAGHGIPEALGYVARTCQDLQYQRHEADYNFVRIFKKENATSLINDTATAHEKWKAIKDHEATKVFLVALLVHKR